MNKEQVLGYVQEILPEAVDRLKQYASFPTVSAQHKAIPETVEYVVQMIREAGGETKFSTTWAAIRSSTPFLQRAAKATRAKRCSTTTTTTFSRQSRSTSGRPSRSRRPRSTASCSRAEWQTTRATSWRGFPRSKSCSKSWAACRATSSFDRRRGRDRQPEPGAVFAQVQRPVCSRCVHLGVRRKRRG